jgi:hypothetical protein
MRAKRYGGSLARFFERRDEKSVIGFLLGAASQ